MTSSEAVVGGEVGDLYRAVSKRLEGVVRGGVEAPDEVIEDACQCAWMRLVDHRERVHRVTAPAWLAKTATREARKLVGRELRERSLETELERVGDEVPGLRARAPEDVMLEREPLQGIGMLSQRQQRLVWLQALGLTYTEMASHEGDTERTVERQLLRAKRRLRSLCGE